MNFKSCFRVNVSFIMAALLMLVTTTSTIAQVDPTGAPSTGDLDSLYWVDTATATYNQSTSVDGQTKSHEIKFRYTVLESRQDVLVEMDIVEGATDAETFAEVRYFDPSGQQLWAVVYSQADGGRAIQEIPSHIDQATALSLVEIWGTTDAKVLVQSAALKCKPGVVGVVVAVCGFLASLLCIFVPAACAPAIAGASACGAIAESIC